jgi:hypothetical protein
MDESRLVGQIQEDYSSLEKQFTLEQGTPCLAAALTPLANQSTPIHRWFAFKEAFGATLMEHLSIDGARMDEEDAIFVDPFCGSGTTLLAGDLQYGWSCHRIGVETNPFIAFVANVKAAWRAYDPQAVMAHARAILTVPLRLDIPKNEWPSLSTFQNPEMFDETRVSTLLDAVHRSRRLPPPYSDLFLLGVASAVEKLSLYRRTGRALRSVRESKRLEMRRSNSTESELLRTLALFAADLSGMQERRQTAGRFTIMRADSRALGALAPTTLRANSVASMVYSPPYLNQIDYTEVYKVESWLLGFVNSADAMRQQRLATVRSHSSISSPEAKPDLSKTAQDAIEIVSTLVSNAGDPWHRKFRRTALGYFSDMQQSFKAQFDLLEPGAPVRCVIGNSAHGPTGTRIALATDLILADVAAAAGFDVTKVQVGRMLPRRDHLNQYLRESVLWMKKPTS